MTRLIGLALTLRAVCTGVSCGLSGRPYFVLRGPFMVVPGAPIYIRSLDDLAGYLDEWQEAYAR